MKSKKFRSIENEEKEHNIWCIGCYELRSFELDKSTILVFRVIQENLIKSSLQNSLPYILLQTVCANYCASYPK